MIDSITPSNSDDITQKDTSGTLSEKAKLDLLVQHAADVTANHDRFLNAMTVFDASQEDLIRVSGDPPAQLEEHD